MGSGLVTTRIQPVCIPLIACIDRDRFPRRGPPLAKLAANPAAAATFDQLDAANRYRLNAVARATTRDRKLAEYVDVLARGESLHPRKLRKDRR
ncbi:YdeI/OmpD-associated family protein [Nocardia pseudovaccinii]|uniref:YdeI/OmpD-associated family protein n=1 Tax=Nocardia pseudovaccinii TaxID=189540 RepID=UPI003D8E68D5